MMKFKKGFTLIELLTSVSIFAVIMIVSLGSITGIFDANRQTRSLKAVVNNLNLAMETMSKEVRYGTRYHCGEGTFDLPQNCPGGGTILSFFSSDNEQVTYRLADTRLEKKVGSGDFAAVTAPELVLEDLVFYVLGAGTDNTLQPKVIIKLRGYGGGDKNRSPLTLQTLVSQRLVDEDPTAPYGYPSPSSEYPTPATFWDVTVSKAGTGSGTVSGPGINCGSDCEESFADGSNATLTASPNAGSTFGSWSGACSGTGACNLIMNANKAVTATFSPTTYTIEYLIVAGGGGGGNGGGPSGGDSSGGGGGGGVIVSSTSVVPGSSAMAVTVGGGGGPSVNGSNSSIASIATAIGGGRGGTFNINGSGGGSGGGGGGSTGGSTPAGGAGTAGQGNNGGGGANLSGRGGGGGGAGGVGGVGAGDGGAGGVGISNSYSGAAVFYGGGGGGGGGVNGGAGSGSGGNGASSGVSPDASSGLANRGGGGGGGTNRGGNAIAGGSGGSGIVIIRYAGAQRGTGGVVTCTGGGTPPNCVGHTVHTFTGPGSFTP